MISPDTLTKGWHVWHVLASMLTGATAQRVLVAIVRAMPPLPDNAGFWQKWAYAALKAVTGHEPTPSVSSEPPAPDHVPVKPS